MPLAQPTKSARSASTLRPHSLQQAQSRHAKLPLPRPTILTSHVQPAVALSAATGVQPSSPPNALSPVDRPRSDTELCTDVDGASSKGQPASLSSLTSPFEHLACTGTDLDESVEPTHVAAPECGLSHSPVEATITSNGDAEVDDGAAPEQNANEETEKAASDEADAAMLGDSVALLDSGGHADMWPRATDLLLPL